MNPKSFPGKDGARAKIKLNIKGTTYKRLWKP